jgi:hypothetical protein
VWFGVLHSVFLVVVGGLAPGCPGAVRPTC